MNQISGEHFFEKTCPISIHALINQWYFLIYQIGTECWKYTELSAISINLLVVYRESVNLIGYITIDYQLIVYGKIVAHVIV